jgi:hypothetical protein
MAAQEQTLSPLQVKLHKLIESILVEALKRKWKFLDYSSNSVENKWEKTNDRGINLTISHLYLQDICEIRFWCAHFVDLFTADASGFVLRPNASEPAIVLTETIFTEIVMRKLVHPFSH